LAAAAPGGGRRILDVRIRRAAPEDADFLVDLLTHEEVEPYLAAVGAKDHDMVVAEIERSGREPDDFGLFVIEVDGRPAGTMRFEVGNRRNRIARLGGLAIHPDFRGSGLGDQAARAFQRHLLDELGFHRLELEVYGFNERALRHAERVGFVREGVKRKAYWRHGEWVDGVLYGMLAEDLDSPAGGDRMLGPS
jgi:RimJ/RimL family protein N-acetyltransferase